MRFLTSITILAATISALPITSDITTPVNADALDNNALTPKIAATADANDGPNWGYGPPNGGYNNGPGYGYGPAPGNRNGGERGGRGPPSTGGAIESIGYGLGTVIGAPVGWLGDFVGGAGSGLYNGLKGGYKMIKA